MAIDVLVYNDDGEIVDWESITDEHDIHKAAIAKFQKHFVQAEEMPFILET